MRTEHDPEAAFQLMCDSILPDIHTWEDMYNLLDRRLARVSQSGSTPLAVDLILTMYCIFQAMRDLPEEGDIKVLMKRALRILTVEGKERLGIDIAVLILDEDAAGAEVDEDAMETATTLQAKGITLQ